MNLNLATERHEGKSMNLHTNPQGKLLRWNFATDYSSPYEQVLHAHFERTDIYTSPVNIHEEQACQDAQNIIMRLNPGGSSSLLLQ